MTDADLETIVARYGDRFEWLTSDANPDAESREEYRRWVTEQAAMSWPPEPVDYPPLTTQLVEAARAAARFAASGLAIVDQAEHDRRQAICEACEHFDAEANRCRQCGCSLALKPWGKVWSCPIGKW